MEGPTRLQRLMAEKKWTPTQADRDDVVKKLDLTLQFLKIVIRSGDVANAHFLGESIARKGNFLLQFDALNLK